MIPNHTVPSGSVLDDESMKAGKLLEVFIHTEVHCVYCDFTFFGKMTHSLFFRAKNILVLSRI